MGCEVKMGENIFFLKKIRNSSDDRRRSRYRVPGVTDGKKCNDSSVVDHIRKKGVLDSFILDIKAWMYWSTRSGSSDAAFSCASTLVASEMGSMWAFFSKKRTASGRGSGKP